MTTGLDVRQRQTLGGQPWQPGELSVLSIVVPKSDMPLDRRLLVVEETIRMAMDLAMTYPMYRSVALSARSLNAADLGLTRHWWNETVTATLGSDSTFENSTLNATTGNTRTIGIYGVLVASPVDSVATLRFIVGGKRTHQWDLQAVMADPEAISHMPPEQRTLFAFSPLSGRVDPVLIPPNTPTIVQHYVRSGTAVGIQPSELVLLGVVIEPEGAGGAELVHFR